MSGQQALSRARTAAPLPDTPDTDRPVPAPGTSPPSQGHTWGQLALSWAATPRPMPTGRGDVPVRTPNSSPDHRAPSRSGPATLRPGQDHAAPLAQRSFTQARAVPDGQVVPSDPTPSHVQGRPGQHTVPGAPSLRKHGVPNTGAPCSQCRALSSHPQSLQPGLSTAQGCAWSRHGPRRPRCGGTTHTAKASSLVSGARRPRKASSQSRPQSSGHTATLRGWLAQLHLPPASYKGLPGPGVLCCPALAQGAIPKAELRGPQPHKPRAASSSLPP